MGQGALVRQNYSVKPEPSTGEKAPSFCSMEILKKISLEKPLPKPPIFSSPKPVIEVTEKTVKSISIAQKSPVSNQSSPKAEVQKIPPRELFCEKIWKGQDECKDNEALRKAFIGYIRSFDWTGKVSMDIQDQLSRRRPTQDLQEIAFNDYSVRSRTSSSDSKDMEAVAATMMKCTQLKIRDSMDSVKPNRRKLSMIETCFNTEELRDILVTTLWPLFLSSEAYQHFLNNPEEPFILYEEDENPSATNFRCSESEKARQMKEVYVQTAQSASDEYLNKILIEGRWADKVLSYLEKAPFSFSISSADREAKGFPILYVNGAFESTTRYERSEVIGRGHGFLKSPNTEEDQLMKIADALSKGEGCKIAITNRRKNGVDFLNFLALRPVLSRHNEDYKYVIAVQYDITTAEASLRQMKMVNDFLSLIGNILKA